MSDCYTRQFAVASVADMVPSAAWKSLLGAVHALSLAHLLPPLHFAAAKILT